MIPQGCESTMQPIGEISIAHHLICRRGLLGLVTGASDGGLRIWRLDPTEESGHDSRMTAEICAEALSFAPDPAHLQMLAEIFSGRRVDQNAVLVRLTREELSSVIKEWFAKHP